MFKKWAIAFADIIKKAKSGRTSSVIFHSPRIPESLKKAK